MDSIVSASNHNQPFFVFLIVNFNFGNAYIIKVVTGFREWTRVVDQGVSYLKIGVHCSDLVLNGQMRVQK